MATKKPTLETIKEDIETYMKSLDVTNDDDVSKLLQLSQMRKSLDFMVKQPNSVEYQMINTVPSTPTPIAVQETIDKE